METENFRFVWMEDDRSTGLGAELPEDPSRVLFLAEGEFYEGEGGEFVETGAVPTEIRINKAETYYRYDPRARWWNEVHPDDPVRPDDRAGPSKLYDDLVDLIPPGGVVENLIPDADLKTRAKKTWAEVDAAADRGETEVTVPGGDPVMRGRVYAGQDRWVTVRIPFEGKEGSA